jgi:DNA-binding transcriptional ArsR family regulator
MTRTRRTVERPPVTIDVAPAYELLMSVVTMLDTDEDGTYEVGEDWISDVRTRAGDDLITQLRAAALDHPDSYVNLLALVYDAEAPRDVGSFLAHLRATEPDEIRLHLVGYYARETRRMTPASVIRAAIRGDADARAEFLRTSHPDWEPWTQYLERVLDTDAVRLRTELVDALEAWNQRVWAAESLTILPILERDVESKREMLRELPMERFIETATNGVEFVPRPGIERVVMVPSFVNRPLVSFTEFGEVLLIVYPVADESVSAFTDSPPLRLVRLSKALGDEKRLRILRALAEGEKTLVELADTFGAAKTTMHHHMIILRSAGLVSVGVGSKRYRLRRETVPDVGALLSGYLGAAAGPSAASRPPVAAARSRRTAGT